MHPVGLRFGLGVGPLATEVNRQAAIGMDGPCLHRARAAIEAAQRAEPWLKVRGFGERFDDAVDGLAELVATVRGDWTDRQRELAFALREEPTQRAVAERFDLAPSTVSESLSVGHVHGIHDAERALAALLADRFEALDAEGADP